MWDTYQKSKEFNWWFNKEVDIKNTRELKMVESSIGKNDGSSSSSGNSTVNSNSTSNDESSNTNKFSDTPQGTLDNLNNYLTSATLDNSNSNSNSNDESISKNSDESISNQTFENEKNGNHIETYTSSEAGNIGTTSSADLIKGWINDGLVEVNKEIFKDCKELFMLIY